MRVAAHRSHPPGRATSTRTREGPTAPRPQAQGGTEATPHTAPHRDPARTFGTGRTGAGARPDAATLAVRAAAFGVLLASLAFVVYGWRFL